MIETKIDLDAVLERLPAADRPGRESKFTGPERSLVKDLAREVMEAGQEGIEALVRRVAGSRAEGESDYRPAYLLHALALHSRNEARRGVLTKTLARLAGDAALPDPVRATLVRELETAADDRGIPALAALLADDGLADDAVRAIVAIGGDRARAALRESLALIRSRRRVAVLLALGKLRDDKALVFFLEDTKDEERDTRLAALWGLARLGHPSGAAAVLEAASKTEGWERIQATKACLLLAEALLDGEHRAAGRELATRLAASREANDERYVREAAERLARGA